MNESALMKLHWDILLKELAERCQTQEATDRTHQLRPNLKREQVERTWLLVDPLRDLINQGYRAPIGDLSPVDQILRAANLGQQLDGMDLRLVFGLLDAVKRVGTFISDFHAKCITLEKVRGQIYPIPSLMKTIERTVDEEGKLHDDASPELKKIRDQKRGLRRKIETKIQSLLHSSDYEQYLQDDFFTYRQERYVVPIRLDGRGRVKGNIQDTSASGQTLYIEPLEISPLNGQLQELELAEKLEIIRIFKELTKQVSANAQIIEDNYKQLIELDFLSAQAEFANNISARPVNILDEPKLALLDARHPLLKRDDGKPVIPNDISFSGSSRILIISGPNAGGKTVVLETTGIIHLMAKAGLLLPVEEGSEIFLFDNVFVEMGDSQNLTANLSTFSGHLHGMKRILEKAGQRDLVLLDEIAVGTEPTTGAAIAQAILEKIARKGVYSITTTHYDALKGLALENDLFKNGSMEYSLKDFKPTYKLILDVPGQSYGLEVAEQLGVDKDIIERARVLKGSTASTLDRAVSQLMIERDKARETTQNLEKELLQVKSEKYRWEQEVKELKESRQKAAEKLSAKYEDILSKMKLKYQEALDDLKKSKRQLQKKVQISTDVLANEKQGVDGVLTEFQNALGQLTEENAKQMELPGKPAVFGTVKKGDIVYLVNMNKTGTIVKEGRSPQDAFEVDMGGLKMRVYVSDMRQLPQQGMKQSPSRLSQQKPARSKIATEIPDQTDEQNLVIQSKRNTVDVRGFNKDDAIERMWQFVDQAVLRGEYGLVIVHGHGTDVVKNGVRDVLKNDSPYELSFRSGEEKEGGDGVTIVMLRH